MKTVLLIGLFCGVLCCGEMLAQEANSGFELRGTVTGQTVASSLLMQPPRNGSVASAGFRSIVYPTFKMSEHWTVTGALQLYTRPYFQESFSTPGYGAKGNVLQATLNYSRVSDKGSLLVRVGQMSTSFGSFLLRYDDADNALVNLPIEYGYYYAPVSTLGVAGAQVDVAQGKWDARVQFANSSPANPRSIFGHDQYGNWAGGAGYTIRQGLRVGVSGYRGPYLDRHYAYFFPGEANPNTLQANALGLDVAWSRGHWNVQGELQKFVMPYAAIPTFHEQAGYAEVKRVLSPRWYVAAREGYANTNAAGNKQSFEAAAGFRPNRFQLIKLGYEMDHSSLGSPSKNQTLTFQVVTSFHVSATRN